MSDAVQVNQSDNPDNHGHDNHARLKYFLSWAAWPGLFVSALLITAYGFANDQQMVFFILAYVFMIACLFFLEKFMPHEDEWLEPDGQTFNDLAHTFLTKGTVHSLFVFAGVIGISQLFTPMTEDGYGLFGPNLWPREMMLILQVAMGVVISEFFLYWSHRTAHEFMPLWRFHAIHHSVTRLWFVNTGRFHFIDSLYRVLMGMIPLVALGAPMEVVQWMSAVTAFIGILTHCNVEMRFGPISYVFNTPGLHRWHHSRDIREGNKNYGENVVIWDMIFRTYINPKDRRPPANIGINEYMPARFTEQLVWPFLSKKKRKAIRAERKAASEQAQAEQALKEQAPHSHAAE